MSTICFEADELGNVLQYLTNTGVFASKDDVNGFSRLLAVYSAANTRAYVASYGAKVEPCEALTPGEIRSAMPGAMRLDVKRAIGTLRLMHYNTDELRHEEAVALAEIHNRAFRLATDALEARSAA